MVSYLQPFTNAHVRNENLRSTANKAALPSVQAESSPVRRCVSCLLQHPLERFRLRRRGGEARMRQCRLCHNQGGQLRRPRERGLLTKRQFHQYLTSAKNQRTGRSVERVYLDLVQQFGGTEGLLRMWTHTIEKNLAVGGVKAYRHIASILRLMEYREDAQPDKPDDSTVPDEELLHRMSRAKALK